MRLNLTLDIDLDIKLLDGRFYIFIVVDTLRFHHGVDVAEAGVARPASDNFQVGGYAHKLNHRCLLVVL